MDTLWSFVVGILVAIGVYLILERHLIRVLFGLIIISSAVNLAIFTSGRLTSGSPPLIAPDAVLPVSDAANSLPQALILTAIVIGFGLLVFTLLLFYRAFLGAKNADIDAMTLSEENE